MNYEELMKDVMSGKIRLELMIDRAIQIGDASAINESGYERLCDSSDEEKYRALLKRGEDFYYAEKEFCADLQQSGSCNYQYEKIYKVILNDHCECVCEK